MNVAVIGASDNSTRYAYKALTILKDKGHNAFPVHPSLTSISGIRVFHSILEIPDDIDTVSIYINAERSDEIAGDIVKKNPRRIIFNPGAENPELFRIAAENGIIALNACTIVLLNTDQF